jgi:hypothetical protein
MSTGTAVSSSGIDSAVDTVVLRYFLFVDRADLLIATLGRPIGVPRTVFDPDEEPTAPEEAMSEIRRSITVQSRRSGDLTRDAEARTVARRNADRLRTIHQLHSEGALVTLDMTVDERRVFSELTSATEAHRSGLRMPLGAGEAACVAIAINRSYVLATDDDDALRAQAKLVPDLRRARVRSLLRDASTQGLISEVEANALHQEMRNLGFWDTEAPFP